MEVFEVRERIDDTESVADLMLLLSNVREDIAQIESAFASSSEGGHKDRAVRYAIRLKYFNKVNSASFPLLNMYKLQLCNNARSIESFYCLLACVTRSILLTDGGGN